ncbi:MAG TPA: M48 family metallopeptidase [Acidobacteriota bacterium]|nr:M48 family metallopeptidase [Acidobacteriota bacterium]
MDFFEHQELARRNSRRLLFLFALAVLAVFLAVYLLLLGVFTYAFSDEGEVFSQLDLVNVPIFWISLISVVTIVGSGSLWKLWSLRGGGRVVAESMGGRLIPPQTSDLNERRVLNVVEEMALASGVPVPPVYLLQEEGINAFAAGYQPGDAVVGVTEGTVKLLKREEVQGVIAHEFSHILNGDMRLNLRLIGLAHGILVLGLVGEMIMRSAGRSRSSSSSKKKDGNGAIFMLGAGLLVIGWVGTLSASLIKSAVSRQREFLADASAVQFTRNPHGLSGALKKIGGLGRRAAKMAASTQEISHMLFSARLERSYSRWAATHPPLKQRILRLEPDFDGRFPRLKPPEEQAEEATTPPVPLVDMKPKDLLATRILERAGTPHSESYGFMSRLLATLPAVLLDSVRETYSARALIYALLLHEDDQVRSRQMVLLQEKADPQVVKLTAQLLPEVRKAGPQARLPLVDMAISALRGLSPDQYRSFRTCVDGLIAADEREAVFEWVLGRVLMRHLEAEFGASKPPPVRHRSLKVLAQPCSVLLSRLSYAGHGDVIEARRAFHTGAQVLDLADLRWCSRQECGLDDLGRALETLNEGSPQIKRELLKACAATVSSDNRVTVKEGELLRGIADTLGCPVPPFAAEDDGQA